MATTVGRVLRRFSTAAAPQATQQATKTPSPSFQELIQTLAVEASRNKEGNKGWTEDQKRKILDAAHELPKQTATKAP